jgi:hypothetical protein
MFWKRKRDTVESCADALYHALCKAVMQDGRIHVEDLISAAAAIVGEASIAAAGDFDPRRHQMVPGTRAFSTKVNVLICDDKTLAEAPGDSIVGTLRDKLLKCGFAQSDFPVLKDVFEYFAAHVGKGEEWGRVPLSTPKENRPFMMPLRVAYETRAIVDANLAPLGEEPKPRLHATALTLAKVLCETRQAIDPRIATRLAIETVNGMAKTAPMTAAAMAQVKEKPKDA